MTISAKKGIEREKKKRRPEKMEELFPEKLKENAIRRVINLRLKSAGSFRADDMAEYILFLRSQFLSGRWRILMKNITRRWIKSSENDRKVRQKKQIVIQIVILNKQGTSIDTAKNGEEEFSI